MGIDVHAWSFIPDKPVASLQLVHGMMEHSGRYLEFARWLAGKGVSVYMNDHPGHGKNLRYTPGEPVMGEMIHGHFADRDGWGKLLDITVNLTKRIKEEYPGLPVFILGHSMGSVLVQSYLRNLADRLDGAILSGPLLQPRPLLQAGILLVAFLKLVHGPRFRSDLLKNLGYGSYSKFFKPVRTEFDWLCSDEVVVDKYVDDPLCGFPCTNAFYADFFRGLRENLSGFVTQKNVPLLIFAGKQDPTGHFGRDPVKMSEFYKRCGFNDVVLRIWPNGRHEMLNEINKTEVWQFVLDWIQNH